MKSKGEAEGEFTILTPKFQVSAIEMFGVCAGKYAHRASDSSYSMHYALTKLFTWWNNISNECSVCSSGHSALPCGRLLLEAWRPIPASQTMRFMTTLLRDTDWSSRQTVWMSCKCCLSKIQTLNFVWIAFDVTESRWTAKWEKGLVCLNAGLVCISQAVKNDFCWIGVASS